MSKITISFRLEEVLSVQLDALVILEGGTRSDFLSELVEKYLKEKLDDPTIPTEIKERISYSMLELKKKKKIQTYEKRIKEIKRKLRGSHSRDRIQRFIDREPYYVAKSIYDDYAEYYENYLGTPLMEPIDI